MISSAQVQRYRRKARPKQTNDGAFRCATTNQFKSKTDSESQGRVEERHSGMAIAATISLPLTSPTRRSINLLRPSSSSSQSILATPQRTLKYPNSRIVASSMSIDAPVKTSSSSFLDRNETGFLHFAKYHGLGNDFVLVSSATSPFPASSALIHLICVWVLNRLTIETLRSRRSVQRKPCGYVTVTLALVLMELSLCCLASMALTIP